MNINALRGLWRFLLRKKTIEVITDVVELSSQTYRNRGRRPHQCEPNTRPLPICEEKFKGIEKRLDLVISVLFFFMGIFIANHLGYW